LRRLSAAVRYPEARAAEVLRVAEPTAETRAVPTSPPAPALFVDLRELRVTYRGHEIPTRPPNHLQRQPLLALAVLASKPGETLSMAEVAKGMFALGGLRKKPIAPDARDLRYKLLRVFRKALKGAIGTDEIERLVESVSGMGLRLNVTGSVELVVAPAAEDAAE
jgi:hypothetical protein